MPPILPCLTGANHVARLASPKLAESQPCSKLEEVLQLIRGCPCERTSSDQVINPSPSRETHLPKLGCSPWGCFRAWALGALGARPRPSGSCRRRRCSTLTSHRSAPGPPELRGPNETQRRRGWNPPLNSPEKMGCSELRRNKPGLHGAWWPLVFRGTNFL